MLTLPILPVPAGSTVYGQEFKATLWGLTQEEANFKTAKNIEAVMVYNKTFEEEVVVISGGASSGANRTLQSVTPIKAEVKTPVSSTLGNNEHTWNDKDINNTVKYHDQNCTLMKIVHLSNGWQFNVWQLASSVAAHDFSPFYSSKLEKMYAAISAMYKKYLENDVNIFIFEVPNPYTTQYDLMLPLVTGNEKADTVAHMFAHELGHVIFWGIGSSTPWFREMVAETVMLSYFQDRIPDLVKKFNEQKIPNNLHGTPDAAGNVSADGQCLFMQYIRVQLAAGKEGMHLKPFLENYEVPAARKDPKDQKEWEKDLNAVVKAIPFADGRSHNTDYTYTDLVRDFFLAAYLRQNSGRYGFAGDMHFKDLVIRAKNIEKNTYVMSPQSAMFVTNCSQIGPLGANSGSVSIRKVTLTLESMQNGTVSFGRLNYGSTTLTARPDVSLRLLGWQVNDKPQPASGNHLTINLDTDTKIKALFGLFNGSGTKGDPFLIKNGEDLRLLSDTVNLGNSFAGTHFKQTADISLKKYQEWIPIGAYKNTCFSGVYNGDKKTITDLNITASVTYVNGKGFFGLLSRGTFLRRGNIGLKSPCVRLFAVSGVGRVKPLPPLNTGL